MCYEFHYACDGPLIEAITNSIGTAKYFMFCVHHKNYIYTPYLDAVTAIIELLTNKTLILHRLSDDGLMNIIDAEETIRFHTFHGSLVLFNKFKESRQKA